MRVSTTTSLMVISRVIEDCGAGSGEDAREYALRAMEYLQLGAL
ncbi:MAG: hypothetical protein OSB69_08145 [Alphaproteobacteria bacterium]|nr:hypothetical protein [Alphaproteobacteria bacterium]